MSTWRENAHSGYGPGHKYLTGIIVSYSAPSTVGLFQHPKDILEYRGYRSREAEYGSDGRGNDMDLDEINHLFFLKKKREENK